MKRGGGGLIHPMSSFNFIFCSFGSVCLLIEVGCDLVIFGNNSNHSDQYGHITMEGTPRSFNKLLRYIQELVLMRRQHGCKRQTLVHQTIIHMQSSCVSFYLLVSPSNDMFSLKWKSMELKENKFNFSFALSG